jgi:hypothetical protein
LALNNFPVMNVCDVFKIMTLSFMPYFEGENGASH